MADYNQRMVCYRCKQELSRSTFYRHKNSAVCLIPESLPTSAKPGSSRSTVMECSLEHDTTDCTPTDGTCRSGDEDGRSGDEDGKSGSENGGSENGESDSDSEIEVIADRRS